MLRNILNVGIDAGLTADGIAIMQDDIDLAVDAFQCSNDIQTFRNIIMGEQNYGFCARDTGKL